jgi:hypothetical protein
LRLLLRAFLAQGVAAGAWTMAREDAAIRQRVPKFLLRFM